MLSLIALSLACQSNVLSSIAVPAPEEDGVAVALGKARVGESDLAGVIGVYISDESIADWLRVLKVPENQEEWHPSEMGTKRVERVDPHHIYQQVEMSFALGAVQIRRQAVVEINWMSQTDSKLQNCWQLVEPTPFQPNVAAWVNDAPWQKVGMGGWNIYPLPDGRTFVSYQFWTESKLVPTSVQAWVMSKTLPNLMNAFEARVEKMKG